MHTRPLEKLTPNTAASETIIIIIIIKAIYDTAFIHRDICPRALFYRSPLLCPGAHSTPVQSTAPRAIHVSTDPQDKGDKPCRAPPAQPHGSHPTGKGKGIQRGKCKGSAGGLCQPLPTWGGLLGQAEPCWARLSRAGPPGAVKWEQGPPKALQSHPLTPAPDPSSTSEQNMGWEFHKPQDVGPVPVCLGTWRMGIAMGSAMELP